MTTNKQNQAPERDPETVKIVEKVNGILGIDNFEDEVNKRGINKALKSVLNQNKDNIELAKIAIRESYSNLSLIDFRLLKDPEIAKEIIKSGIKYGASFFELDDFVNKNFKLDSKAFKTVYKYFNDKIKQASRLYNDDLLKTVQVLNEKESKLLEIAKEKKLLTLGKVSRISTKFIKFFEKSISSMGVSYLESPEDKKRLLNLSMLENYLGIELKDLDEDELFFIKTILTLSLQSIDLKKIDDSIEDKKEKEKLDEELDEEYNDLEDDYDIDFDERLDFCSPGCSYISLSGGGYEVDAGSNRKLKITQYENSLLTSTALKNYITFYNTLYDLGLNFLWDKYKSSFTTLCNNKFGFNYINGEGITESKLLSSLNLIGKNIGVPEKEIIPSPKPSLSEGERIAKKGKNKVACFDRLGEAKLAFKEIRKTGKINGEIYSDMGAFSSGAVENYLKENQLSDINNGKLNISKWI